MLNPYSELTGSKQLSGALRKTLQGEWVSHAYLFAGPAETGKRLALAFAQALLCEAPVEGEACGLCRACRLFSQVAHPDFHWVRPEGSSIKIRQIREIQRTAAFRPFRGGRKLMVIEQSDKMTLEAANCLLKTLEEPPPAVHFILLAPRRQYLPATVVSRCQCFTFGTVDLAAGLNWSETGNGFAVDGVGEYTEGDFSDPLAFGGQGREEARRLAAVLAREGSVEALAEGEAAAKSREQALNTLEMLTGWYRDLLIWRETKDSGLLFCPEQLPAIEQEAAGYPTGALVSIIEEIEKARRNVSGNTNVRLLLEGLFLRLNNI